MSNNKGFTLVETLVAGAVFLAALSAFSFIIKSSVNSVQTAREMSRAIYLAASEMEELKSAPFEKIASKTFAGGRGKIIAARLLPDLKSVEVTLEWHPKRKPIKFWTLRSAYE